ncbi:HMG-box [Xylona heveae TC161]|uniref:HMG-box n=1 Tax=Xylona heveae (strain CBS 132557 / TC161) TaxID=1328760 RepID=A0A165IAT1_XYLHT|nr:HMG-box [Xylona heveae TC161]KZF24639.1 HMG-box [Xylona heveae TC161]
MQKLQRAIADARGHSPDRSLASPSRTPYFDESRSNEPEEKPASIAKPGGRGELGPSGKRKYRRHPKPDENAPARPPSAYVIFSNKIRDDLKDHELSFTEIAKLVGEKWQELSAKEKEPYERQANAAKEQHLAEMAEYKKTQGYQDYLQYLAEFKAKYGGQQGGKRVHMSLLFLVFPSPPPTQTCASMASGPLCSFCMCNGWS